MMITFYSNHCPRCEHLESLLKTSGIHYEHVMDTDLMLRRGFTSVPMLEIDGQIMDYPTAVRWLRERNESLANQ